MSQALYKCLKLQIKIDSILIFFFVLGADEYLERLEGKIKKCLFFYVVIFENDFYYFGVVGPLFVQKIADKPKVNTNLTIWVVSL